MTSDNRPFILIHIKCSSVLTVQRENVIFHVNTVQTTDPSANFDDKFWYSFKQRLGVRVALEIVCDGSPQFSPLSVSAEGHRREQKHLRTVAEPGTPVL